MEVVPSLCATGTLGVAALGYAFGRPETTSTRPQSNKRKVGLRADNGFRSLSEPLTPVTNAQSISAPATQAPKPRVLRRPQSASFASNISGPEDARYNRASLQERDDWRASLFNRREDSSSNYGSLDPPGSAMGTAKSSWLKRMSTFTSSQGDSPISTPRPSTPSISFSNGSSAPFIPTDSSPMTPRNKLVKRSTSHRMLHSSNTPQSGQSRSQLPMLRRPATSYQRSASLQQQYVQNEVDHMQEPSRPSYQALDDATMIEDVNPSGGNKLVWRPYFYSRATKVSRDTFSRNGGSIKPSRNDTLRSIASTNGDLPTLLKATSISSSAADKALENQVNSKIPSRPLTPAAINPVITPSTDSTQAERNNDKDSKRRTSFSISDIFPSPSPSMWKMPRTSSLRRKKGSESIASGRRIVSAPQASSGGRRAPSHSQTGSTSGLRQSGKRLDSSHVSASHNQFEPQDPSIRSPSSPLPPLDRLSTFEINLPYSAPSYPTSPHPQPLSSPSSQISTGAFPPSHPVGQTSSRLRSHRPSGVHSDHASTVAGSDNDNSRVFTVDGDETDYRSETVYDSLRTDATGSSHSGVRGPRIENVFDASAPHSELLKKNLTDLQEKLTNHNNTHFTPTVHNDFIAEEEESVHTPVGISRHIKENIQTPSRYPTEITSSPDLPSSPPVGLAIKRREEDRYNFDENHLEEGWSFDENELHSSNTHDLTNTLGLHDRSITLPSKQQLSPAILNGHSLSLEEVEDDDSRTTSNVFDWSERHLVEKASQQGSSPRPKTVHGNQGKERGSRTSGRRGASALHLRSQSVPLPPDSLGPRGLNNTSKLDAWMLGGKGVSEDWDSDFEFEESNQPPTQDVHGEVKAEPRDSNRMLVPRSIMERQASVHGQFGQVKELTLLVEELKHLRHQASVYDLVQGQSSELWKEAEGIINLATVDEEDQDFLPSRSPRSPSFDFDAFDEDSPASQRRRTSSFTPPRDESALDTGHTTPLEVSTNSSPAATKLATPTRSARPRKESVAKAKFVLENIHQQRSTLDPPLTDVKTPQKKLPFDTTSLRDLVTRAGVVTRALKEIVRRAENVDNSIFPPTPEQPRASNPPDPPFSQIFHQQPASPASTKRSSPRMVKSTSRNSFMGGAITGNDNEINGHMKMMTVV